jgi:hypothetical protein
MLPNSPDNENAFEITGVINSINNIRELIFLLNMVI